MAISTSHIHAVVAVSMFLCVGFQWPAHADGTGKQEAPAAAAPAADEPPSIADSIPALAGAAAFKKQLKDKGITVQLNYIGEILGNISGGVRRGSVYDGRLEAVFEADMEKVAGWTGGTFHTNIFWIHGDGLSRDYVGNLLAVSNIEALPTARLFELWYEQKLFNDKVAVRAGQLAADTEFVTSKYAGLFINGTFGWPGITASNLPSGGPAYPLATPGVRLKLGADSDPLNLLVALYDGDPAGPGDDDPQRRNRHGLNFRTHDRPLLIEEAQYRYMLGGSGLAGTLKIGAWQHFGRFDDLRYDVAGLPIAVTGDTARSHSGNHGFYGVWDQQLYRLGDDPGKGIGFFTRVSGNPGDRNLIDFYVDAGLNFSGLVPGRPDDAFGVAVGYARVSDNARGFDIDAGTTPARDYEAVVELTYQAQILPGWTMQPLLQYIFHPGGSVPDENGARVRDAVVVGMRTTVNY
jgi:porin